MNTLLLIDGNALMHRAYHAIPPFKTKDGIPTNVIFGFFSILNKAVDDFKPSHLIVCFDVAAPTFRKKMFNEYKAQRKKLEDNFIVQIPFVKEGLNEAKIIYSEKPGFEADDVIGTLGKQFGPKIGKVLILSGDKDILQLVDKNIFVVTPHIGFAKTIVYDRQQVIDRFGVTPKQMADFKALAGDQSDNYPGAKGIGPKTASQLINQFKTIEKLLKNINDVKSEKIKLTLIASKEDILMAKKLSEIDKNVDVKIKLEETRFDQFPISFKDFLFKYEMYTLANRFFKTKKQPTSKKASVKKDRQNSQMGLF